MIDPNQLTKDDIGRGVIFNDGNRPVEDGTITSFNDRYIFVCFDHTGRGKACYPNHLEFLN